jgi:hypothetical protein
LAHLCDAIVMNRYRDRRAKFCEHQFPGNSVPFTQDLDLIQLRCSRGSKILVD